jgi:HD-GYP domain-containing protein (c-di-GMP phosphodiesterase class II)
MEVDTGAVPSAFLEYLTRLTTSGIAHDAVPVKALFHGVARVISRAADTAERAGIGHAENIASLAVYIGKQAGLPQEDLWSLWLAGLFHDTGMATVSDAILRKTTDLTPSDLSQIRGHAAASFEEAVHLSTPGVRALGRRRSRRRTAARTRTKSLLFPDVPWIVRWHHERADGQGYPDGLNVDEMSMAVRVLRLADSFTSLTEPRSFRKPHEWRKAREMAPQELGADLPGITDVIPPRPHHPRIEAQALDAFGEGEPSPETIANMLRVLATLADSKHKSRTRHSLRSARIASDFARSLGLTIMEQGRIYALGLLHDLGMLGLSDLALDAPEPVSGKETLEIRRHPVISNQLISAIGGFDDVGAIALCHHERWDGGGYPQGLYGDQIALPARIVAIADTYEAMSRHRPYHPLRMADPLDEIARCGGSQFDPTLARQFAKFVKGSARRKAA